DELVGCLLRASCRDGDHADDDVLVVDDVLERPRVEHGTGVGADLTADHVRIAVEHGGDVDAVLLDDRRARDRLAESAGADQRDVVLALRAQDLPDLAEQAVDAVADPALAELAEAREITTDL